MKKHAILTASDKKYGDFLIEHWLKSLQENVRLDEVEIIVVDYGLSAAQRYYLKNHNVRVFKGKRDGHVTVIRFRDFYKILAAYNFDQVLICDSGDMIFQADISRLFNTDKKDYRAVCEDNKSLFSFFINDEFFSRADKIELLNGFLNHKMINAGFLLGPRLKMKYLCWQCMKKIKNKEKFGPDQIVINSLLHKKGFTELAEGYNFVISSSNQNFNIKDGKFYFDSGKLIPVIHNTGNLKILRPIENFGYGKGFNTVKYPLYVTLRMMNTASNNLYGLRKAIINN